MKPILSNFSVVFFVDQNINNSIVFSLETLRVYDIAYWKRFNNVYYRQKLK